MAQMEVHVETLIVHPDRVPERGDPVAPGSALRGEGHPVTFGTSFVLTVDYAGDDVQAWSMLTYGQTGDRDDPLFDVQTERFAKKSWRAVRFTADEIAADSNMVEQILIVR